MKINMCTFFFASRIIHVLYSFYFTITNVQSATKLCDQTKDFQFLWQQGKKVCDTNTVTNLCIVERKVYHDALLLKVHCCICSIRRTFFL
jgi:hypothetical protein